LKGGSAPEEEEEEDVATGINYKAVHKIFPGGDEIFLTRAERPVNTSSRSKTCTGSLSRR